MLTTWEQKYNATRAAGFYADQKLLELKKEPDDDKAKWLVSHERDMLTILKKLAKEKCEQMEREKNDSDSSIQGGLK
jgi:hypothetical protein